MLMVQAAYASRIRAVHPAEKAGFSMLCLLACLLAGSSLVPLAAALVLTAAALGWARMPLHVWAALCRMPLGFLLLAGAGLALEIRGVRGAWSLPLGRHLFLGATPASLSAALHATARSLGCTLAMLFLAATTPLTDLIALMRRGRVPVLLIELLALSYRAIFLLQEAGDQMRRAQASRLGYSGFRTSIRSSGLLIASLLGRSLVRAEASWRALLSRGYEQTFTTQAPEYRTSRLRMTAGVVLGLGLVLLAGLSRRGHG